MNAFVRLNRDAMAAALVMLAAFGCAGPAATGPYAPGEPENRNASRAELLTREAVECADSDAGKAEELLREALTADLFHGPAHNNLGVLFFRQGKLYEAANEFEWARKLLPGHPDPRLNLALVLERAGHVAEAFSAYDSALESAPEHVPTMQAYARLAVREGRRDERVEGLVRAIALRGEDERWREWARREAHKSGRERDGTPE